MELKKMFALYWHDEPNQPMRAAFDKAALEECRLYKVFSGAHLIEEVIAVVFTYESPECGGREEQRAVVLGKVTQGNGQDIAAVEVIS